MPDGDNADNGALQSILAGGGCQWPPILKGDWVPAYFGYISDCKKAMGIATCSSSARPYRLLHGNVKVLRRGHGFAIDIGRVTGSIPTLWLKHGVKTEADVATAKKESIGPLVNVDEAAHKSAQLLPNKIAFRHCRHGVAHDHDRCLATLYYPLHDGSTRTHQQNQQIRQAFCKTLAFRSSIPTVVLHQRSAPLPKEFDLCPHVIPIPVDLLQAKTDQPQYRYTRTKFEVWKVTPCRQVLLVDLDSVFIRDPALVFDHCPPEHPLCAVHDQGMPERPSYFNAGVLVLRPSLDMYKRLNRASMSGTSHTFPEQDTLNEFPWHPMPVKCNLMAACCHGKITWGDTIIVHEKIYLLGGQDRDRALHS